MSKIIAPFIARQILKLEKGKRNFRARIADMGAAKVKKGRSKSTPPFHKLQVAAIPFARRRIA